MAHIQFLSEPEIEKYWSDHECDRRARELAARRRRCEVAEDGICTECEGEAALPRRRRCYVCTLKGSAKTYLHNKDQWTLLDAKLKAQNFKCYYTGKPIVVGDNASLDHRLSRYNHHGDVWPYLENLVWCDRFVNVVKNKMDEEHLYEFCETVLKTRNERDGRYEPS